MAQAIFIDTSVMLNLLGVPGNVTRDAATDRERLKKYADSGGHTLILPLTTVIESGNAIVRDAGSQRRQYSQKLVTMLRATLANEAPWVASGVGLTHDLLSRIVAGHPPYPPLLELMTHHQVGTGDASILAEVAQYKSRVPTGTPVAIWTHDDGLERVFAAFA